MQPPPPPYHKPSPPLPQQPGSPSVYSSGHVVMNGNVVSTAEQQSFTSQNLPLSAHASLQDLDGNSPDLSPHQELQYGNPGLKKSMSRLSSLPDLSQEPVPPSNASNGSQESSQASSNASRKSSLSNKAGKSRAGSEKNLYVHFDPSVQTPPSQYMKQARSRGHRSSGYSSDSGRPRHRSSGYSSDGARNDRRRNDRSYMHGMVNGNGHSVGVGNGGMAPDQMNPISRPPRPKLGIHTKSTPLFPRSTSQTSASAAVNDAAYFSDTGGRGGGGRSRHHTLPPGLGFDDDHEDCSDCEQCSTCSSSSDSEFDYYLDRPSTSRIAYVDESYMYGSHSASASNIRAKGLSSAPTSPTTSPVKRRGKKKHKKEKCIIS